MASHQRKSREDWQKLVQLQVDSGQTIAQFCQSQSLTVSNFYKWKAVFQSQSSSFNKIPAKIQSSSGKIQCMLPNGTRLEWNESVSPKSIAELLRLLS